MDITWHDSDLAFTWLDDSGAVGSNKPRFVLRVHNRLDLNHVKSGDTFSDAHDEVDLSFHGFEDGIGCEWGRHVDDRCLGTSGGFGLAHVSVDGQAEMGSAGLPLVDSADDSGSVFD